jgi:hypothetical protein
MPRSTQEMPEGLFQVDANPINLFTQEKNEIDTEDFAKKYNAFLRYLVEQQRRLIHDLGFDYNCRVYNDANISHTTSGTEQKLTFNQERWDIRGMHDPSTNSERITAVRTGVYLVGAHVEWAANATGDRWLTIKHTDSASTVIVAEDAKPAIAVANPTPHSICTTVELAVGDYVELFVNQTSTAALNVLATSEYSPELWVQFVSPATS